MKAKYILLITFSLFFKSASAQFYLFDSLVHAKLPYNDKAISLRFDQSYLNPTPFGHTAIKKAKQWLNQEFLIRDSEYRGDTFMRIDIQDTIILKRNLEPIVLLYTFEASFADDSVRTHIYRIFYKNIPDGRPHQKLWTTAAEEAIIDDYLYKNKWLTDPLRADFKKQTLLYINDFSSRFRTVIKSFHPD